MARTKLTSVPRVVELPGFELSAEKLEKLVPDAYQPAQMICRLEDTCVAKASRDNLSTALLGILAGFFIGLGAVFCTLVTTDMGLGFGLGKLLGGLAFSLGLILVVVAGAELFTGNALIIAPWLSTRVSGSALLRNWAIVYFANFAGALILVAILYHAQFWALNGYGVGANALTIASGKSSLAFVPALCRGILCNALVCLAVWMCLSARSVTEKVLAIAFPITAFVACGFEHSIANMFFIPMGIAMTGQAEVVQAAGLAASQIANVNMLGLVNNLIPVTIGNIIGGTSVGIIYWLIFLRKQRAAEVLATRHWFRKFVTAKAQPSETYAAETETKALISVLARARDDDSFLAELSENPDKALEGYNLTSEAKAALASGDLHWLESRVGFLDEPLRTWFVSRLSQEKW
ncbi:MAG TPA: formate/nitrite transporter family protein [Dehalococcoidia bacterium]|jgi:formate/nitrite transporter|nr:formate/nitrite transporter family protein [Dehalococcoidia bacterium]